MKILGIDTSSKVLSIAVSENTDIIREESHLLDRKHSSLLVPKIEGLLKKSRIKIQKIDAFVAGLGPGSFTGLRIGVSTIKGFGLALQKPYIGVASIDAIARNATAKHGQVIPIIDAKRGQVYAAIYARKGDQAIRKSGYLLIGIEKLMKRIKGEAVFLGDGVSLYREKISILDKNAIFLEEKYWYPRAGNLIKLGFTRIQKQKRPGLNKLEPMYMYSQYCQIRSA